MKALALALAAALGCGNEDPGGGMDGPRPDAPPADQRYLPLSTGATWTYKVTPLGLPPEDKSQTVMAFEAVPDRTDVMAFHVLTEKIDGTTESWQADAGDRVVRYREKSYDLAGTPIDDEVYTPYKLRLDESGEHTAAGAAWTESYTEAINGAAAVARSENWTVEAVEEDVTVPAGTFTCLRVRRQGSEFGQADKTFYFARGVGKVKELGDQTEELVSYSLPQ
jgi:hypothetical protein